MISTIVPVFASEKTLARCLESIDAAAVEAQVDVEVVMVFDGPDSLCEGIVREWHPSSWISQQCVEIPHSGIPTARNAGVDRSTADVVTFMDADDEMVPARLSFASRCPEGVLTFGRQYIVGDEEVPPGLHRSVADQQRIPYLTSMVMTRSTFRSIGGFTDDQTLGDDWDLVVRARDAGIAIRNVDEVWVVRHLHESNASRAVDELAHDYVAAIRRHLNWLRTHTLDRGMGESAAGPPPSE